MREPTFKQAAKEKRQGRARTGASKGRAALRTSDARPALPPVRGGKALARIRYFQQQHDLEESTVKDKAPAQPLLTAAPGVGGGARTAAKGGAARKGKSGAAHKGKSGTTQSPFLTAFTHKQQMNKTAPAAPIQQGWRPLGPFCIPHGQTYGDGPGSRPAISGRISSIAVDPTNDKHILIGSGGGGVWETKDTGTTWQPRTDNQPSLSIGALAYNPSDPKTVYAGTGEGDGLTVLGVGLLRSNDGGTTWTLIARAPFQGQGFYDLAVDPLNGNHLFAATINGLYESTNGGVAWTQRLFRRCWDISIRPAVSGDPTSTKEIFAACDNGLFRSINGGTTFAAVSLPGAPTGFERLEVCHAPSDGNVVYVFGAGAPIILDPVDSTPQDPVEMFTPYLWRRGVFNGAFTAATSTPADLQTGQAWYDWYAGVAPNNPNVLYVGGINSHKGVRSATNTWTWTNISAKKPTGDSIHPDQHAIAFSPTDPNVVYVGCDGGIFRSPDGGIHWRPLNKGLNITEFEFLAQHPQFEAWLLGGTQDNGTLRYEGEEVWYHVQDGDGGDIGENNAASFTCFHTFFGMGLERSTRGGSWQTWQFVGPNVAKEENYPNGALFYPPVEVNGPVVAQAGKTVFISRDNGTNWSAVPLPGVAGLGSALAIPTPTRVYVGTESGRVYRIEFTAGAWGAPVTLAKPADGFISDIMVDPTNPNRLWVTYSSLLSSLISAHVFRSDNAGATWINVSAGLPNIAVNAVEIDPLNPDTVWVAADVGVFRSTNAGSNWSSFNANLPNALVKDLVFHGPARLLRCGTQSRGVWEIPVDQAAMPGVEVYLRDSVVDTGRLSPSPSGVNDPFNSGAQTFWFQCTDIKVDAPSFQRPNLDDVDFEIFEDDHGVFASGLLHENPQRNKVARVYVQVHNRGVNPATDVAVKVFFAAAAISPPNLPANFWTNFPNNTVPANSPWQPIASHKVIPVIDGGRSQIVGFEWAVPAAATNSTSLLAIISAGNDSIATTELNVATLVQNNKKCGLKNLTVVNPLPTVAPHVSAMSLMVRATAGKTFSLGADKSATDILRGVVLSKRLAKHAQAAKLTKVKLSADEQTELARVIESDPTLKGQLDLTTAYAPARGIWLKDVQLTGGQAEPLVVLVEPKPRSGYGSLIQVAADGTIVGGFTFEAQAHD